MKEDFLGTFEQLVMFAVLHSKENAYGMVIRQCVEERTARPVSIGAVYTTLERLQAKGYVSSVTGEPTAERSGRPKRFFKVEASGEAALKRSVDVMARMTDGLQLDWAATV